MTEETKAESQAESQTNTDELSDKLKELNDLLGYYQGEAKKAFEQRDKAKQELRSYKQKGERNQELDVHIKSLEDQLAEKTRKLEEIEYKSKFDAKLSSIQKTAKELGVKEQYLDKLDKFVDFDAIEVEKAATIKHQVDVMRSNFPDLFQETGKDVDSSFPSPKFSTDTKSTLQEQFEMEKSKGLGADLGKLKELWKKIQ